MRNLLCIAIMLFISNFVYAQSHLKTGTAAPLFKAQTFKGNTFDLKNETHNKQVVIMFYRGQWCPYCNQQMSELQDSLEYITNENAVIIAITPEKPEEISKTIEKTGASFDIIYDENHLIMDLYKVSFKISKTKNTLYKAWGIDINKASGNNDLALPVPATYIINQQGIITGSFFDENYKNRISVKEIIATLKLGNSSF
ncbi:redoxin domain-containing protein [Labilibacter sediminis]|nr:redoxin domain-containing protein [Labilibacter sediminis]